MAIDPAKGVLAFISGIVGVPMGALTGATRGLIKGKNEIYLFEASMASPSPKWWARLSGEFQ